jgi:hypothetical protein
MRDRAITIALGLIAGLAGAWLVGRGAPEPAAREVRVTSRAMAPIVPPAWDSRFFEREDRARPRAAPEPAPADERRDDRLAHYQTELEHRGALLAAHDAEGVDGAWSRDTTDQLRASVLASLAGRNATIEGIDCRTKTCTTQLAFASPDAALAYIASAPHFPVTGLNGLTVTPTPPNSDGTYELTIVHTR